MSDYMIILAGDTQRQHAQDILRKMPLDGVVEFTNDARTLAQNRKMWPLLQDIVKAKLPGREKYTREHWKAVFMKTLGEEVEYLNDLEGMPFPSGFRSSKLNKEKFSDLITFIIQYGDANGVQWSEKSMELVNVENT